LPRHGPKSSRGGSMKPGVAHGPYSFREGSPRIHPGPVPSSSEVEAPPDPRTMGRQCTFRSSIFD
jgi:hypothetical protein